MPKLPKPDVAYRCKCGLPIYVYDAARSIAHELPQCAWFTAQLAANPPDASAVVIAEHPTLPAERGKG